MNKILEILWHYTPRGIPTVASNSLVLDNRPPLYSPIRSGLGSYVRSLAPSLVHGRNAWYSFAKSKSDSKSSFLTTMNSIVDSMPNIIDISETYDVDDDGHGNTLWGIQWVDGSKSDFDIDEIFSWDQTED